MHKKKSKPSKKVAKKKKPRHTNPFVVKVIECLYDDVGWDIHSAHMDKDSYNDGIKDAKSEFTKSRIRVRYYVPEKGDR